MRTILLLAVSGALIAADVDVKDTFAVRPDDASAARTSGYRKLHSVVDTGRAPRNSRSILKIAPFLSMSGTEPSAIIGLRVQVPTDNLEFQNAPVVFNIDGTVVGPINLNWTATSTWASPRKIDANLPPDSSKSLLTALSTAKDAFLTVLADSSKPRSISFRLSAEQLQDCRLVVEKLKKLETSR